MRHYPVLLSTKLLLEPAAIQPPAERPLDLDRRQRRGSCLHEAVHQKRPVYRLLQELRAPERLLHLGSAHEDDPPHAHRRQLRQQPLHRARARGRKDQVDPRRRRLAVVHALHRHHLSLDAFDDARADQTVHHARLQRLPHLAVKYREHMLGPRAAKRGASVRIQLVRVEKYPVHCFGMTQETDLFFSWSISLAISSTSSAVTAKMPATTSSGASILPYVCTQLPK